jgi:transcriptional regulator with XRE-family HTH domain
MICNTDESAHDMGKRQYRLTTLYSRGTICVMSPATYAFYEGLGRRLHALRKRKGLTQEQLGARLAPQMTRASIANIESGKQRVLAHTLLQFAAALDVGADDLLRDPAPAPDETLKEAVDARLQGRVSPEQLTQLIRKLGLGAGGTDDANTHTNPARAQGRGGSH